jgi:hypothetical protein
MRIVILGDFGSREKIGSPEGLDEPISYLNHIASPMRPIMGNHVDGPRFFTNGVHGDRTRKFGGCLSIKGIRRVIR